MRARSKRRSTWWRVNSRLMSPLVLACGIIAIFYVVYRVGTVTYSAVVTGENLLYPKGSSELVCSEEEGADLQDPTPALSANYQRRVENQPRIGKNLIVNPKLDQIVPDTGLPEGYEYTIENSTSNYQYLKDEDDSPFLRIGDTRPKVPADEPSPAWMPNPIRVRSGNTYTYSFQYRSNVPVRVSLELYQGFGGALEYANSFTLKPSAMWQKFTAHIDVGSQTKALRIIASGAAPGRVDTRGFDAHRVADATLPKGVVSVTFDDGWQSVNDKALELLEKYDIRTTQYIISEVAQENIPEYMNFGTVARFKEEGHEIGSHSLLHCDQTKIDPKILRDNAVNSKQILEQQQLGPIKSFAYPLGQYNEATQAVYTKQYPLIRTSDFGYNDKYFDETAIHSVGVLSTTTGEEFKGWLDYARIHKMWLVLVYHRVDESGKYNVTSEQLDRQLKMVAGSGLTILPLGEAAEHVRK